MMHTHIGIIGSGMAGYELAKAIRQQDQTVKLHMITATDGWYYAKPMLSMAFARGKTAETLPMGSATEMAEQLKMTISPCTEIETWDRQAKTIALGEKTLQYEQLVLATGSQPCVLTLCGDAVDQVYTVNHLPDYRQLRAQLATAKRVVIIGAGLVGTEFANDLSLAGYAVTVVVQESYPVAQLLPPEVGVYVGSVLANQGVTWRFSDTVVAVNHAEAGLCLTCASGAELTADVVLSAIGLQARTDLAQAAGLPVHQGIVVDEYCRTADPDVYALGDCAEVCGVQRFYLAPMRRCVAALTATLLGTPTPVTYPAMPVSLKIAPACPVSLSLPPEGTADGTWTLHGEAPNLKALYHGPAGQLQGFVLTGDKIRESVQLLAGLPAIFSSP